MTVVWVPDPQHARVLRESGTQTRMTGVDQDLSGVGKREPMSQLWLPPGFLVALG